MSTKHNRNKIDSFQNWYFELGTRLVEVFSAVILLAFSIKHVFGFGRNVALLPKYYFDSEVSLFVFIGVAAFAVLQLIIACKQSIRSNLASGVMLLWSGAIFAWLVVNFALDVPPTSAVTTYTIMSITCFLAGREVLSLNRTMD